MEAQRVGGAESTAASAVSILQQPAPGHQLQLQPSHPPLDSTAIDSKTPTNWQCRADARRRDQICRGEQVTCYGRARMKPTNTAEEEGGGEHHTINSYISPLYVLRTSRLIPCVRGGVRRSSSLARARFVRGPSAARLVRRVQLPDLLRAAAAHPETATHSTTHRDRTRRGERSADCTDHRTRATRAIRGPTSKERTTDGNTDDDCSSATAHRSPAPLIPPAVALRRSSVPPAGALCPACTSLHHCIWHHRHSVPHRRHRYCPSRCHHPLARSS